MIYSLKMKIVGLPYFQYALSILIWSSEMVAFTCHSVCGPFHDGTHCPLLGYTCTFRPSLSPCPAN